MINLLKSEAEIIDLIGKYRRLADWHSSRRHYDLSNTNKNIALGLEEALNPVPYNISDLDVDKRISKEWYDITSAFFKKNELTNIQVWGLLCALKIGTERNIKEVD